VDYATPAAAVETAKVVAEVYTFVPTATAIKYPDSVTDTTKYLIPTATVTLTTGVVTIPGSWTYSDVYTPKGASAPNAAATLNPNGGDLLGAGKHVITATFAPTTTTMYVGGSATATITVAQGTLTVAYATPDTTSVVYGNTLGAAYFTAAAKNQDATALTSTNCSGGAIVYTDGATGPVITTSTVLHAGTHKITATCTSSDTVDYPTPAAVVEQVVVTPYTVTSLLTFAPANMVKGGTVGAAQTTGAVNQSSILNPNNSEVITCAWTFSPAAGTAETTVKTVSATATCTPQTSATPSAADADYKAGAATASFNVTAH
jgi:hypothetical protein